MFNFTIAKKINIFTIALALIGIIGCVFSVITSVSSIKQTETLAVLNKQKHLMSLI